MAQMANPKHGLHLFPASTPSLPPSLTVKAVPQHPYTELSAAVTSNGLLIKPTHATDPQSILRISWNSTPLVEDIPTSTLSEEIEWSNCPIFYGIVGIVRLFRGSRQPI